jgi:hypothetical protein
MPKVITTEELAQITRKGAGRQPSKGATHALKLADEVSEMFSDSSVEVVELTGADVRALSAGRKSKNGAEAIRTAALGALRDALPESLRLRDVADGNKRQTTIVRRASK